MGRYVKKTVDWDLAAREKAAGKLWPQVAEACGTNQKSLARACQRAHSLTLNAWYRSLSTAQATEAAAPPPPPPATEPTDWIKRVHDAARFLAPVSEIAELMDCTEVDLHLRYHEATGRSLEEGLRQYYGASKLLVRKHQFKSLADGSVSAAIWLGKQCLGQEEGGTPLYASPRCIVLVEPAGAKEIPAEDLRRKRTDGQPD